MSFHPMIASDQMLCCAEACLQNTHNQQNDDIINIIIFRPPSPPPDERGDVTVSMYYDELDANKRLLCNRDIEWRGNNNMIPFRPCQKQNFLTSPIPLTPTHQNYLVCKQSRKDSKCCSKTQQLFNNITKRK